MPRQQPDVRSLVDAQAAARDHLAQRVVAFVQRAVAGFTGWYSDAKVAELAAQITVAVEAGQSRTAYLTDAYLARVISHALGKPVPPIGVHVDLGNLRSGISHQAVYERLGPDYRYRVSQGSTPEEAQNATMHRALGMTEMDLGLAMRTSAQQVYEAHADVVSGYRRVIHPEASRGGSCGLCAAASDRVYKSSHLLPIHERCRCETLPIIGSKDPGRTLNYSELSMLYTEADSTKAADLKKVRVRYADHGELGPVLREQGQHFRGPAAADAASRDAVA